MHRRPPSACSATAPTLSSPLTFSPSAAPLPDRTGDAATLSDPRRAPPGSSSRPTASSSSTKASRALGSALARLTAAGTEVLRAPGPGERLRLRCPRPRLLRTRATGEEVRAVAASSAVFTDRGGHPCASSRATTRRAPASSRCGWSCEPAPSLCIASIQPRHGLLRRRIRPPPVRRRADQGATAVRATIVQACSVVYDTPATLGACSDPVVSYCS